MKFLVKNRLFLILALIIISFFITTCVDWLITVDDTTDGDANLAAAASFAPSGFTVSQVSATAVLLKWSEVEDATGYRIERAVGENGNFEEIGDITGTSYTDDTIHSPGEIEYFYRVTAYNDSKSATTLPLSIVFQEIIVNASQHAYINGAAANENGVYPVIIRWKKPYEGIAQFVIERSDNPGSGFSAVGTVALDDLSEDSDGFYYFIDINSEAKAAKKYYYRMLFLDSSGEALDTSDEYSGWGALTHTRYMIEYNKVMNTALGKLELMYKTGGLLGQDTNKLGKESRYDDRGVGVISYDAQMAGLGARIIIKLENYADFYIEDDPSKGIYFMLTGESNTTSSMSKAGFMDGTMTCEGMYPGEICYGTKPGTTGGDGIKITNAVAAGNSYVVSLSGFPEAISVIWNENSFAPGIFRVYQGYNAAAYPYLPSYYSSLDLLQPNERTQVNNAIDNPDPFMKLPWLNW